MFQNFEMRGRDLCSVIRGNWRTSVRDNRQHVTFLLASYQSSSILQQFNALFFSPLSVYLGLVIDKRPNWSPRTIFERMEPNYSYSNRSYWKDYFRSIISWNKERHSILKSVWKYEVKIINKTIAKILERNKVMSLSKTVLFDLIYWNFFYWWNTW